MGYKRAGFKVIGNVEIDAAINKVYVANFKPKYNYNIDLREFNQLENLPSELYQLDILDGSPPCTTFSICGQREKNWGKEKKFAEGQKLQRLDDLFFTFLDTVEKLRPKIVIAENVKGLIIGNARGYVAEILERFKNLGYEVQIFLLNSAYMDVPQSRERVFFIANNQHYPKLRLEFKNRVIPFGEVRTPKGRAIIGGKTAERLKYLQPTDTSIGNITERLTGKKSDFNTMLLFDDKVAKTITASSSYIRMYDKTWATGGDFINTSTFPQDYNFLGKSAHYICGMCVPPNMMANIAMEVKRQWLKKCQVKALKFI